MKAKDVEGMCSGLQYSQMQQRFDTKVKGSNEHLELF